VKRSPGFSILILIQTLALITATGLWAGLCSAADPSPVPEIPAKGKITMVDFGRSGCFGCWLHAPTIKSLEKKYQDSDQVAIIYVNTKTQADQVTKYQIEAVPTQIFFDKDGKEVCRHSGGMSEGAIVSRLKKMGAKL